jgi:hypothetical protein
VSAPTYPAAQNLVEGTGTRAFTAVATPVNAWLVVEIITEQNTAGESFPPTCPGLTFGGQNDGGTGGGDCRVLQLTAPDAAGSASRVVTITPSSGTRLYRARLTVCDNCDGPGTGKATSLTGQTVSVARQADRNYSGIFMIVGDFAAGAVGTPLWTPGGATVASQQGTGATYLFGRWDDTGIAATQLHGITSPAYATPAIAVLEMLGTVGTPATEIQPGVYREVPAAQQIRR